MKKMKLFCGILIGIMIISSCSSDNSSSSNVTNGFTVNGTFYPTTFAYDSGCTPHIFIFSSTEDTNLGKFGRFDLRTGTQLDSPPLTTGLYTISNGKIDDNIHFDDVNAEDRPLAYVAYSGNYENGFQSGTVTINSVTFDSENCNVTTNIDLDYEFKWEGITVTGNYSGMVEQN